VESEVWQNAELTAFQLQQRLHLKLTKYVVHFHWL